jgi:hypothetical protein
MSKMFSMRSSVSTAIKSRPVAVAFACLLASNPVPAKDKPRFDLQADPASNASQFLKLDKPAPLASLKRVAISNFRVELAVENSSKAQSSSMAGATSVKADVKLSGVDAATRKAIANSLYDEFTAQLTQAGYEVVPYEAVRENADYRSLGSRLLASSEPVRTRIGASVFMGPHEMPYYFSNDDRHLGLGATLGGFSTIQPQNIEPAIAKSLNAAVLRVVINVQFADQKSSGGMFRNASRVNTSTGLAIFPQTTQVLVVTPDSAKSRITLNSLIVIDEDVLTMEETTANKEKVAQAVGNVITGALTGITRSAKKFEVSTTPEAYADAIRRYGTAYLRAVATAMRSQH